MEAVRKDLNDGDPFWGLTILDEAPRQLQPLLVQAGPASRGTSGKARSGVRVSSIYYLCTFLQCINTTTLPYVNDV